MQKLKAYIGILFLLLFLFPQVNKAFHDIEHADDFHCKEKSGFHLHEKTHACNLCDFALNNNSDVDHQDHELNTFSGLSEKLVQYCQIFISRFPSYFFSLRAPPSI